MPNLVSLTRPSLQILSRTQRGVFPGISNIWISGQSFTKKNCRNPRNSNFIDTKCGAVTKLDKRNTATSKTNDDDVISLNCDFIVIFLIYDQFGVVRKPDSGCMACKTYILINSNFLSYKNWKQNWKISNTALILFLSVKVLFVTKNANFLQRKCWHQQGGSWY